MKKIVKLFALALILVCSVQAMAQSRNRGTMFISASFPMMDYAEFENFHEFALTSNDEDGGAGIGFNAGLKWNFNVGVEGLGVMLSVDGFYNGPCSALKTAYRRNEGIPYDEGIDNESYKATPKYINAPAMLGLNYMFRVNPNLAFYVEAGAGGNFRYITDMEYVYNSHVSSIHGTYKVTTKYDKAFSFAYQAGLGVEVSKSLVIGCSFYSLGAAQVKGDRIKKMIDGNATPTNHTDYIEYGTMNPIMILARIGFSF